MTNRPHLAAVAAATLLALAGCGVGDGEPLPPLPQLSAATGAALSGAAPTSQRAWRSPTRPSLR